MGNHFHSTAPLLWLALVLQFLSFQMVGSNSAFADGPELLGFYIAALQGKGINITPLQFHDFIDGCLSAPKPQLLVEQSNVDSALYIYKCEFTNPETAARGRNELIFRRTNEAWQPALVLVTARFNDGQVITDQKFLTNYLAKLMANYISPDGKVGPKGR